MADRDAPCPCPRSLPERVLQVRASGDTRVCIDLAEVERVLPLVRVQEVPGGPGYLVGLMNVHGEAMPVVDLALRLGLSDIAPYGVDALIVLCRANGLQGGLVVRQVVGVAELAPGDVQMADDLAGGVPMLRGALSTTHGLSLLVDTARLLTVSLSDPTQGADQSPASTPGRSAEA